MKSVLISIQPYWVFLIIAKAMGWDIPQEKIIEVRKDYPTDKAWNRVTHIYCGKNRKSFNRIPNQYQPFMEKLLGKVIGEFMCERIVGVPWNCNQPNWLRKGAMLSDNEYKTYLGKKDAYCWPISDLKIYEQPKELGEFCKYGCDRELTRPPQSWCYVEGIID